MCEEPLTPDFIDFKAEEVPAVHPEDNDLEEYFEELRRERVRKAKRMKAMKKAIIITVVPIILLIINLFLVPAACNRIKEAQEQHEH